MPVLRWWGVPSTPGTCYLLSPPNSPLLRASAPCSPTAMGVSKAMLLAAVMLALAATQVRATPGIRELTSAGGTAALSPPPPHNSPRLCRTAAHTGVCPPAGRPERWRGASTLLKRGDSAQLGLPGATAPWDWHPTAPLAGQSHTTTVASHAQCVNILAWRD